MHCECLHMCVPWMIDMHYMYMYAKHKLSENSYLKICKWEKAGDKGVLSVSLTSSNLFLWWQ